MLSYKSHSSDCAAPAMAKVRKAMVRMTEADADNGKPWQIQNVHMMHAGTYTIGA